MLRAIPSAASFTFEDRANYLDALSMFSDMEHVRVTDPQWTYTHSQDSVEFFAQSPRQLFARDCSRKYAAGALSVLHRINH